MKWTRWVQSLSILQVLAGHCNWTHIVTASTGWRPQHSLLKSHCDASSLLACWDDPNALSVSLSCPCCVWFGHWCASKKGLSFLNNGIWCGNELCRMYSGAFLCTDKNTFWTLYKMLIAPRSSIEHRHNHTEATTKGNRDQRWARCPSCNYLFHQYFAETLHE